MALTPGALSDAANALVSEITQMSLHSADPGAAGTSNETTAARKSITLVNDGSGNLSVSNVAFTGGTANGAVQYCAIWAGATFKGKFVLSGDAAFNAAGEYTVTSLTITASST